MTSTSKEMKEAQEAVNKLRSSVNKLADDMHGVRTELANFKQHVSSDIARLVELREKDIDQIREQFAKK